MSVSVRGSLLVSRKSGRKGAFNVGDLSTEIGEFEVKDALIEEFDEGRYSGTFVIKWIECDSFSWRGRVFVKNRASLEAVFVDDADDSTDVASHGASTPPEPDPVDAPRTSTPSTAVPVEAALPSVLPLSPASPTASNDASDTDPDVGLFGAEIYAQVQARTAIKLDPAVDRVMFRAQRDRLKALGYSFEPKEQTWHAQA